MANNIWSRGGTPPPRAMHYAEEIAELLKDFPNTSRLHARRRAWPSSGIRPHHRKEQASRRREINFHQYTDPLTDDKKGPPFLP